MKKIINGKRYDTDTAKEIGYDAYLGSGDFRHYSESLYLKRTGEYFLAGHGGPMTKYARQCSDGMTGGGENIFPLSESEARDWAEEHLTAEEYEAEFEVIEEPVSRVGQNVKAAREAAGLSQKALAEKLGIGQARIAEWESGMRDPVATNIIKLAAALNINPGELLK